jgi:hypothetical protein
MGSGYLLGGNTLQDSSGSKATCEGQRKSPEGYQTQDSRRGELDPSHIEGVGDFLTKIAIHKERLRVSVSVIGQLTRLKADERGIASKLGDDCGASTSSDLSTVGPPRPNWTKETAANRSSRRNSITGGVLG